MRGALSVPLLLRLLAAPPAGVHPARVGSVLEGLSSLNKSAVRGRGSLGFVCPDDCRECCKHPLATSEAPLVQCKLKRPISNVVIKPRASCQDPLENDSVACPLTKEEKAAGVWDSSESLQWGCSHKYRCCCNARGLKLCIGDNTPRERLIQQYGLTEEQLPRFSHNDEWLNLTKDGFCPPGFTAGDGGFNCDCGHDCGGDAPAPELKPRASELYPPSARMATLASAVYYLESPAAGWELVKMWTMDERDEDNVAIYRSTRNAALARVDGDCALVFSGTTSFGDGLADINVKRTSFCGFAGVHKGFAKKATLFRFGPRSDEFMQYLRSDMCAGKISAVGHSLGGAIATLIAACNNKLFKEGSPAAVKFDKLYTYAAPSVSKTPLQNYMSDDDSGCFKGYRFFLQDTWFFDPVPGIASKFGFKHPRLTQVRVYTDEVGQTHYNVDSCHKDNAEALQEPGNTTLLKSFLNMQLHLADTYIREIFKSWPRF